MKPAPFEYHDPRTLDEALTVLGARGDDAKVLAGGQSLLPMLNLRLARPAAIVDLNRVAGLDGLAVSGGVLHLGALVRQRALERWAATECPLIAAVLRFIGHAAIRNRGTVAGSVSHADPAAELPALFVGLDGAAVVRSHARTREIAAHELYRGPLMTALEADEIVVETRWSLPAPGTGWGVHEVSRRHGDFALVGAIALVTRAGDAVDRARIAIFGAGPTPLRASGAEKALAGARATRDTIVEAARLAAADLEPDSDIHASARYRRMAARTLVERALADAVALAGGGL